MRNTLKSTALLLALAMLTSCGGTKAGAGSAQLANIAGAWQAVATSTVTPGSTTAVFTNLTQTTGTFFANNNNIVLCSPANATDIPNSCVWVNPTQPQNYTISIDGTIQAGGAVQITVKETQSLFCDNSGTQTDCTVTLTGNVIAAATQMSGTYTVSPSGDKGTWQATPGSSVTGTYSGTFNDPNPPLPVSITLNLTQNSDFSLTGAATLMGSPCFMNVTLGSGTAIGGGFFFIDSTNSFTVGAIPLGNKQWQAGYYDYGVGPCQTNSANGVLTHP